MRGKIGSRRLSRALAALFSLTLATPALAQQATPPAAAAEPQTHARPLGAGCFGEDPADAISGCSTMIAVGDGPIVALALIHRARAFAMTGDDKRALADLDRSLRIESRPAVGWMVRGGVEYRQERFAEAIADYDEALKREPRSTDALHGRGAAWGKLGQYDKAIADFTQAVTIDPKDAAGFYDRAASYRAQGQIDKALEDYGVAIALEPRDARFYDSRADVWGQLGRTDRMGQDLQEAAELAPADPHYVERLCRLRVLVRELDRAAEACGTALKLAPMSRSVRISLGAMGLARGEPDAAIAEFDQVLGADPAEPQALYGRGLARRMKGDRSGAEADLSAARARDPETGKMWQALRLDPAEAPQR
ncbi:MAG: tetratricopeptide repeat protein [Proteobacteria bacterium]|nr:tetratricopeptide repeat protein [Pseudomonadota bacterium]